MNKLELLFCSVALYIMENLFCLFNFIFGGHKGLARYQKASKIIDEMVGEGFSDRDILEALEKEVEK